MRNITHFYVIVTFNTHHRITCSRIIYLCMKKKSNLKLHRCKLQIRPKECDAIDVYLELNWSVVNENECSWNECPRPEPPEYPSFDRSWFILCNFISDKAIDRCNFQRVTHVTMFKSIYQWIFLSHLFAHKKSRVMTWAIEHHIPFGIGCLNENDVCGKRHTLALLFTFQQCDQNERRKTKMINWFCVSFWSAWFWVWWQWTNRKKRNGKIERSLTW